MQQHKSPGICCFFPILTSSRESRPQTQQHGDRGATPGTFDSRGHRGRESAEKPQPELLCSEPIPSQPAHGSAFTSPRLRTVNSPLHGQNPAQTWGEKQALSLPYTVIYYCVKVIIINLELHLLREIRDGKEQETISHGDLPPVPFHTGGFIQHVPGCAHRWIKHTHSLVLQPGPFLGTFYSLFSRQQSKSASALLEGHRPLSAATGRSISSLTSTSHLFQNSKTFICPLCFNISFLRV